MKVQFHLTTIKKHIYIYIKFVRKTTGQTNFNYVEVPSCCEDFGMLRQWSLGKEGGALIKSSK